MSQEQLSTFEREMLDPVFAQEFEIDYIEFLTNELMYAQKMSLSKNRKDKAPKMITECPKTFRRY